MNWTEQEYQAYLTGKEAKPSKYKNIKCEYKGIKYDSKKELYRSIYLQEKLSRGDIANLRMQPRYEIIPTIRWNNKTLCKVSYVADFEYIEDGQLITEDVKGFKTAVYKLKQRLFILQNPSIEFRET